MGFKIFSQLAYTAFVLLLGQVSIGGQTIGHRFMVQVKNGCLFTVEQVKRAKLFNDVMDAKNAVENGVEHAKEAKEMIVEKAKAVEATVGESAGKAKGLSKEIEDRLNKIRDEALKALKQRSQTVSKNEDEEAEDPVVVKSSRQPAVSEVDQDALLKNLP